MYSAWLEQANGEWHLVADYVAILDHTGNFIVCDDETDDRLVAEKIAAESGKYAIREYNRITLSDVPIFGSLTKEAQGLAIAGVPCVLRSIYGFNVETFGEKQVYWHCGGSLNLGDDPSDDQEKPGFVLVGGNELRYDLGAS